MMLYVASVVLMLFSTVYAYSEPITGHGEPLTVPPGVKVKSKILYDGNYVITEMHGPRRLSYDPKKNWLELELKTDNPQVWVEKMSISNRDKPWLAPGQTVAIETFSYYRDFKFYCWDKSIPIGHMGCEGNIRVRNATSEEKEQLQKFRNEYKVTKTPFKLFYNNGTMRIQSIASNKFDVRAELKVEGLSLNLKSFQVFGEMWLLDKKLLESSFTVESFPTGTKGVDCYGKHPYLEPVSCQGFWTFY